jgi:hypothetical protein
VHLIRVGGPPVAAPTAVHSLVGPDERPRSPSEVLFLWAKGALRANDVERQFDAQAVRLRDAGIAIDHLDTGYRFGLLAAIGAVEAVARRHGISGIRIPIETDPGLDSRGPPRGSGAGRRRLVDLRQLGSLRHALRTRGYVESRQLDELCILEIVARPHDHLGLDGGR